jgi:hypothetical protein
MTTLRPGIADARTRLIGPVLAVIPFGIAIACSILFFGASLATTFADKAAIRGNVAAAFASKAWHPRGNDCLVGYMLLARYDSRLDEVLFPKIPRDGLQLCPFLRDLADNPEKQHEFWTYQRYLHGVRTVVAPLLLLLEAHKAGKFLFIASYALLFLAIAALLWRRWQQGGVVQKEPIGFRLILLGCTLLFYVTPYYGASLAFASSDLAVHALLVTAAFVDPARLSARQTVVLASLFGGIVAYLELLTGQAPLGLTLLLALVAAGASRAESPTDLTRRCLWTAYAFAAGLVLCFVIKMALILLLGADTGGFGPSVLYRMGGSIGGAPPILLGIDITQHAMYSPAAFFYAALALGYWTQILGQGGLALGLTLVLIAIVGLAGGARARWHRLPDRLERTRTAALLAAACVTPAWYLLFLNHTIIHASFMIRALIGFIAIGLWFGCSELAQASLNRWRRMAPRDAALRLHYR